MVFCCRRPHCLKSRLVNDKLVVAIAKAWFTYGRVNGRSGSPGSFKICLDNPRRPGWLYENLTKTTANDWKNPNDPGGLDRTELYPGDLERPREDPKRLKRPHGNDWIPFVRFYLCNWKIGDRSISWCQTMQTDQNDRKHLKTVVLSICIHNHFSGLLGFSVINTVFSQHFVS